MGHKNSMEALLSAVQESRESPRKIPRETFTQNVVEAVESLGLTEELLKHGVAFVNTDNPHYNMRQNAKNMFRWLGDTTDSGCPEKIFRMYRAIIKALPPEIRIEYMNDQYGEAGVFCCLPVEAEEFDGEFKNAASLLTKEYSEAVIAALDVNDDSDHRQLLKLQKEAREAQAAISQILQKVDRKLGLNPPSMTLKAV